VEGVEIQKVDETLKPIDGTKEDIACDTVLLSVGLLPENELTRQAGISIDSKTLGPAVFEDMQTDVEGIFSCGNVCHVHDLVDFVTQESIAAGESAARFVKKKESYTGKVLNVKVGDGIGQCVPHKIRVDALDKGVEISFRVNAIYKESEIAVSADGKALAKYKKQSLAPGEMEKVFVPKNLIAGANGELTLSVIGEKIKKDDSAQRACVDNKDGTFDLICIVCPKGCAIHVNVKDNYKTTGNSCPRGAEYAYKELTAPTRVITSTAIIKGARLPRVPVKTDRDIDKSKIFESMAKLNNLAVKANVKIGDVVAANIDGKGANFVATRDMTETDLPKI
jgi:CxxC motif-containing protein